MTEALLEDIASYLPRLVVQRHATRQVVAGKPAEELFPAALVFVDVSGFTKLAERLAQLGPQGAEQLTRILNAHFGPLIDRIHADGGDVAKFAGDALLVLWPVEGGAPDAANLTAAATRAVACALGLQEVMADLAALQATGGPEALSIKVVVGAGDMRLAHLGGTRDRWEVMVTGPPLVEIGHVSHLAQPGKVLVTPELTGLIGDRLTLSADGFVEAIRVDPARAASSSIAGRSAMREIPAEIESILRGYVPEAVMTRLVARQGGWLSELRRVSVMFVNFPNATHETTLERAQSVMVLLQSVLDRFEGTFNKLSVDEKGVSMVAAFGLPPLAHEDDAARAILAAFALQGPLRKLDVVHAIGISTGQAFCGVVGNDHRREYTVMGDTVNLAARLMQAARQDLLCDQETATLAGSRFSFEALPPLSLKGKAEPVAIFRPAPQAAKPAPIAGAGGPDDMVGRHAERNLLADRLDLLASGGRPGVVLIEGEAGIGKSRLVQAFTALAAERDLRLAVGAGDAIEHTSPYHAWRGLLADLLDLNSAPDDPAARREHLLARLADDPDALLLAPLLGPILSVEIPDNETTAQLTGGVRADNTRDLLLHLIRRSTNHRHLVLVVDDAHWLDSASWTLLLEAHRQIPEILLVLALRPPVEPVPLEYKRLAGEHNTDRIVLAALSDDETLTLVRLRLGARSLPDEVSRLIRDRAAGHPFFCEELAYALRDSGQIIVAGGDCVLAPGASLAALDLPSTVQGAITSRIDRLPATLGLTLKVASVIGRVFALKTLRDVYPIDTDRARLPDHLTALDQLDLTPQESPEPDLAYIFKHMITQQVVYDLMLFAQRQGIHRAVAQWYEREHHADLAGHYPLLAHHWGKVGDVPRTVHYLDKAGELALQSGAYKEAVEFLADADALEAKTEIVSDENPALRKARRQRILGDSYISLGRLAEARECLQHATALLGFPVPEGGYQSLRWVFLHVFWQLRNLLLPGWYLGKNLQRSREELLEASRAFERLGPVFFWLNQPLKTMFSALAGLNLSEWAGPSPELAKSYMNLTVGLSLIPLHRAAAAYAHCALEASKQQDQLSATAWVKEIQGLYLAGVGPWELAATALEEGAAINEKLGDRRRQEECLTISALIALEQGKLDEALGVYAHVAQSAKERGDMHMAGGALTSVGSVLMRQDRLSEARAAIEEGIALLGDTRAIPEQICGHALLGLAYLKAGDRPGAREQAASALDRMGKVRPTAVYTLEGYSAVAEIFLSLWEADPTGADAALKRQARRALAQERLVAKIFPVTLARSLYWEGLAAWLDGKTGRAVAIWRKSLAEAKRRGLPHDIKLLEARLSANP